MAFFDRLQALLQRLVSYSPGEVLFELLLIGIVVWAVIRFIQGTRAAGAIKGLLLILVLGTLVVRVFGAGEHFQRLAYLYDRFLALVAIALIVIFQPELRRGLMRLGETAFFRQGSGELGYVVDQLTATCDYLSKNRFGAIIVLERQFGLRALAETGTMLNAELSAQLLQTIFFPQTALHDLAVLIRGRRVLAASVQLPLADPSDMPDPQLGSRHRAAIGLTKESDALVIVVSEETGSIRLASRARLSEPLSREELGRALHKELGASATSESNKDEVGEAEGSLGAGQEPMTRDPDQAA